MPYKSSQVYMSSCYETISIEAITKIPKAQSPATLKMLTINEKCDVQ